VLEAVRLVLASGSRYRAELVARLDVPFLCVPAEIDERAFDERFAHETDEDFALTIARAKAQWVHARHPDAWVLAADQIAVAPGRVLLHKPGTVARAIDQLMELAGRTHALVTGIVLHGPDRVLEAVDRVELRMRAFDRAEATAYVERHRPLDCCGSYRIEDAGVRLMESITGADPTSIMGLPLLRTCDLLRKAGLLPDG
jgi:septum formation protein